MREIEGGSVTTARGFRAAAVRAGIKPGTQKDDLALVCSASVASAAAVFTTNRVQAAPIAVCREHLRDGQARAVVLNSGNANACTGEQGLADARRMCALAASALGLGTQEVLVCSTGVIGVPLPMAAIEAALPAAAAALSEAGGAAAARAIMTTDTVPKTAAVEVAVEAGASVVRIGGMAKGAGMIAPSMATMLAVVTTDAQVPAPLLGALLQQAASRSFNCITVDGDMSTNDTLIVLANGASGVPVREGGPVAAAFGRGLEAVCRQLARAIARDGEGATKLIPIRVRGGRTEAEARQVGLSVANSCLVKTAVFGNDPNWGRILCAMGYAGVELDPEKVAVSLCGTPIYAQGRGRPFDKAALSQRMRALEVPIDIDLAAGEAESEVFTCDLSYDYVRINAEYTT
ncbi:MAG: bifunctional glutamate N-acetyltransferase/amino-acid acetyltransferase ArgJ [Candidatus Latescibacterota bacterium]